MPSPPLSIVQSLSPRIAVLSADDVIDSCEANGCRGLEELLRPWEGSTERGKYPSCTMLSMLGVLAERPVVSILSSTLTPTIHPTFPLRFVSYASVFTNPGQSNMNSEMVADLIGGFVGAKKPGTSRLAGLQYIDIALEDEQHYPLTRSLLLSSRPVACHETFNHPVGVLFAISTATVDPLGTLTKMYGQLLSGAGQSVPWMDGVNVFKFYLVVHDVSKMGTNLDR
jgi:hypothetical protein